MQTSRRIRYTRNMPRKHDMRRRFPLCTPASDENIRPSAFACCRAVVHWHVPVLFLCGGVESNCAFHRVECAVLLAVLGWESCDVCVAAERIDLGVDYFCCVAGAEEADFFVGVRAGVVEAGGDEGLVGGWVDGVGEGGVEGEGLGVGVPVVAGLEGVGPGEEGG